MTTSEDLFYQAKKLIPGGVNSPVRAFRGVGGTPFFTKKAHGAQLTTADDKELIDYVCTWGPAIHGHNPPFIREAIAQALENGTSFGTPNSYEVRMAELIIEMVPTAEKVRMVNSGTEATMTAIRLARGFTGRSKIIKFSGCYHGHVDSLLVSAGSGALTLGNPDSAGVPEGFAAETIVLPYNDIAAVEKAFEDYKDQIAGVIVEGYPANCGLILPLPGYLKRLQNLCKDNGAQFIFDEVMTGFRVSKGGVQLKEELDPDLTALGKIIGGGLPVGAICGREDIMNHLAPEGPVYQAGTLSGNPLAMAAGIAALEKLIELDPYEDLEEDTYTIAGELLATAREKGLPLQVPNVCGMFALFFADAPVTNYEEATASNIEHYKKLFHHALENGVYLAPSAYETAFVSTAHECNQIQKTIEILTAGLKKL